MRKNKLYILLSILTIIFLFSFAAVCNQCAAAADEEKTDVEEEEEAEEEVAAEEEEEEEEAEEEEEEEEEVAVEDMEEPTVELEIDEGPLYSSTDDVCYWRVKAVISGNPTPDIEWNKDDSLGTLGNTIAQVNLHDPDETFTLTATAENAAGTATDSIELSWGCEGEEAEEEEEEEEEEDGDGEGDGDEVETSEVTIYADPGISGWITEGGDVHAMSLAEMGDNEADEFIRGYFSFDISELHGKTVQEAEIYFSDIDYYGNPSDWAVEIVVKVFNYVRLDPTDTRIGGTFLANIALSATTSTIDGATLESQLQNVLDNDIRDYFQIKLGLNADSNNDGIFDAARIYCDNASLHIVYTD